MYLNIFSSFANSSNDITHLNQQVGPSVTVYVGIDKRMKYVNDRVMAWSERNNLIYEGQNGFRKGISTIDHISSLTQITETRKKLKLSTFCAIIDF